MTGPVRPTGILQPQRVTPAPQDPGMTPGPPAGQPGMGGLEGLPPELLQALLMMLLQGMGQGMGGPPPGMAPPAAPGMAAPPPDLAALLGGQGGP